jgi:hypothetical protein
MSHTLYKEFLYFLFFTDKKFKLNWIYYIFICYVWQPLVSLIYQRVSLKDTNNSSYDVSNVSQCIYVTKGRIKMALVRTQRRKYTVSPNRL